uniref:phosphopantetheine-binding protein n=1 Tax=Aquimarina algiphila TaxID=2047982 RepID=UPI00248FE661
VQLVEIWQEVLGIEKIGIHDDFFELGGHSLSAIKLSFAIKKACEVKIEMNTIFKYSTIELQSQYISIVLSNTNDEKLTDEEVIYF